MMQPFFGALERRRHVEDRLPALHRDHPPRREAAAVEIADHAVDDGKILVAGAHEIGVERVRALVGHAALGGLERLRDHLSAEHATDPAGLAFPAVEVGVDLLDVEQVDELGGEGFGRFGAGGGIVVGHDASLSRAPAQAGA